MLTGILSSIAAAIVNALLGRFFPEHPKVTPEGLAQAEKDRADTLQSQKDARHEADKLRKGVAGDLGVRPGTPDGDTGRVFRPDANQRD